MLAEFMLTPEAFCESSDGLRSLQACLFPFGNPPVALICQLGSDHWETAMGQKIARIANMNQRHLAMNLFQKVRDEIAVVRPAASAAPTDEDAWIANAIQSRQDVELDGIVVSQGIANCPAECTLLADFVLPDHWNDFGNPRLVGRDVPAQLNVLRSFCTFSDWLIIRMPQIRGGDDDEIVTVKQIVELATALPAGYSKSDVEVQVPLGDRLEQGRLSRSIRGELRGLKVAGADIRVTILPNKSFVNREVLGGEYAIDSLGAVSKRARWLMTMNHVAVGGRRVAANRDDANSWNLFARHAADERLREIDAIANLCSDLA